MPIDPERVGCDAVGRSFLQCRGSHPAPILHSSVRCRGVAGTWLPQACRPSPSWRSRVTFDYSILARSNLFARPWGFAFPVIGLFALVGILLGARRAHDGPPFAMTCLILVAAFLSLA
jgi:hypothetical protein